VLEQRLRSRGQDDEASIQRRLAAAGQEIDRFERYDYAIVNDYLDGCVEELKSIVRAARCRVAVMRDRVQAIERTFKTAKEQETA
jgi:guanylate kinase